MQNKLKSIFKVIASILLLICFPYFNTFIYDFPSPSPFSGNKLYNPYQNLTGKWIKANFHAHSTHLFGLANGTDTPEDILFKYDSLGYQLPSVSNYNSVNYTNESSPLFIPVYEHGINVFKTHQLIFGQKEATLFDYPFFQFASHKQHLLNKVKKESELVALAHPSFQTSYQLSDMEKLCNYYCMEVLSPRAQSHKYWDAALSAGKPIWILGNDDCHSLEKLDHYGVCWTMLNISDESSEAVVEAMKTGKGYGVKGWVGENFNQIKNITTTGLTVTIEMEQKADSILLRSDNGKLVSSTNNKSKIEYELQPNNTYVRAEIWNGYTRIFLNPIIRSADGKLNTTETLPTINWLPSILYWLVLGGVYYFAIRWIVKRN